MQLPGADGYLGILPGHAPLITELGIGELSYHDMSGKESAHLAIIRGFAEVLPDRVTVLAETAEFAAEIDIARAEAAQGTRRKAPGFGRYEYRLGPRYRCASASIDSHPGGAQISRRARRFPLITLRSSPLRNALRPIQSRRI